MASRSVPRTERPAAEAGGNLEVSCIQQRRETGVALSHQEAARASYQDHASGSDVVGVTTECHRAVPSAA
jgi:hypothetical protein